MAFTQWPQVPQHANTLTPHSPFHQHTSFLTLNYPSRTKHCECVVGAFTVNNRWRPHVDLLIQPSPNNCSSLFQLSRNIFWLQVIKWSFSPLQRLCVWNAANRHTSRSQHQWLWTMVPRFFGGLSKDPKAVFNTNILDFNTTSKKRLWWVQKLHENLIFATVRSHSSVRSSFAEITTHRNGCVKSSFETLFRPQTLIWVHIGHVLSNLHSCHELMLELPESSTFAESTFLTQLFEFFYLCDLTFSKLKLTEWFS